MATRRDNKIQKINFHNPNINKKDPKNQNKKIKFWKFLLWALWTVLVYLFAIFSGPKLHELYINWNHYKPFNCLWYNCSDFSLEIDGLSKQYIGDWDNPFIISVVNHWREEKTMHLRITVDNSNGKIICSYENKNCDDIIREVSPYGNKKEIVQPNLKIRNISKEENGHSYTLCVFLEDKEDTRNNKKVCHSFDVYSKG